MTPLVDVTVVVPLGTGAVLLVVLAAALIRWWLP